MVLGIVLHTCAALSPSQYWIVTYKASASWADAINMGIHYFRMPLFFIISGFFTIYVFTKKGLWQSISGRVQRILIPLICTLFTLNVIERMFVSSYTEYPYQGFFNVSHLWFLVNLFAYLLIVIVFFRLLKWLANTRVINSIIGQYLIVVMSPIVYIAVLSINYVVEILYAPVSIINSLYILLEYLHLYILGALIAFNSKLLDNMIKACQRYIGLSVVAFSILYVGQSQGILVAESSTLSKVVLEYLTSIIQIFVCISLLGLSKIVLSRANGILKEVADASYTIYLFHHLLIICLITLFNLLPYTIPAVLTFMLVVIVAYVVTLSIHVYIIKTSAILLYLYNGKHQST
jgi:glucan biosynthesis protein C